MKEKVTNISQILEDAGEVDLACALRKADESENPHHSFIFRAEDGAIIAVGGALGVWKGMAEVWIKLLDLEAIKATKFGFIRACLQTLDECATQMRVRRFQCTALASDPASMQFLISLGFLPEGFMFKYDPSGRDHIRFSKIYG